MDFTCSLFPERNVPAAGSNHLVLLEAHPVVPGEAGIEEVPCLGQMIVLHLPL